VRESSAHAWPEVYFPQYGWIEFEPTPSQAAITHQEEPPALADVPSPVPTEGPDGSPTARTDEGGLHEVSRLPTGSNGPSNFGMPGDGWGWLVAAGMAALGILLLFKLPASPLSRGSSSANAGFYYTRMLFWTRLMKVGPAAHQTPYEFSESLAREVPGTSLFARTIARAYVREKYGRDDLDPAEKRTVSGAYESLRSRLLRTWPGRQLRGASKRRR
jgi:hypothetical protein